MIKYKQGFGLVEVIVAAVIGGILLLFFTSAIGNANKGQVTVQARMDLANVVGGISSMLNYDPLCQKIFLDVNGHPIQFTPPTPDAIYFQNLTTIALGDSKIAVVGRELGSGTRIASLVMANVPVTTALPAPAPGKELYQVTLTVNLSKSSESFGSPVISNNVNPLRFMIQVDSTTREVDQCVTGNNIPVITCISHLSLDDMQHGAAQNRFAPFTAADCGGVLPGTGYVGTVSSAQICNGIENFGVLGSGEILAPFTGPGFYFYGAAGWGSPNPACHTANNTIRVVYVHP